MLQFDGKVPCLNGELLRILKPGREYVDVPLFAEPDPAPSPPANPVEDQDVEGEAPPQAESRLQPGSDEQQEAASDISPAKAPDHVEDARDAEAEEQPSV